MAKQFGFGEYERADVGIRVSTQLLRYQFIKTLVYRKSSWAKDLVRIENHRMLPTELLKPVNAEINPVLLDTPLKAFFSYLDKKKVKLIKLEKNKKVVKDAKSPKEFEEAALRNLIPDWKTLKSDKDAKSFCLLLENWANEQNLNSDWFLDFVLMVLIKFKLSFNYDSEQSKKKNIEYNKNDLREALLGGISDYYSEKISKEWWSVDEHFELSESVFPFVFRHKEFETDPITWYPNIIRRNEFIEEAREKFLCRIEAVKELNRFQNIDEEAQRNNLDEYCNQIEKQISQNKHLPLFPYIEKIPNLELPFFSSIWVPSKVKRKRFIANFIDGLNVKFQKYKQMAKSLDSLRKEDFELALFSYCNKIESLMRKNYEKTPSKYTDNTHFEWLVDYQVPPFKGYKEVASEIEIEKRPSVETIRKAVKRLSDMIKLPLRPPLRTGRPKGIKEERRRLILGK